MVLVNPFLRFTKTTDFFSKMPGFKGRGSWMTSELCRYLLWGSLGLGRTHLTQWAHTWWTARPSACLQHQGARASSSSPLRPTPAGEGTCCYRCILASPASRKSAWKHLGFENVKLERNADNFGRECFLRGAWNLAETRPKTCGKNLPTNSLRDLRAIFLNFARPNILKMKIQPESALQGPLINAPQIATHLIRIYILGKFEIALLELNSHENFFGVILPPKPPSCVHLYIAWCRITPHN